MRIYVFGTEGQVARSLREAAIEDSEISVVCGARPSVDVLRPDTIERALVAFEPDLVINPAAYTAVDRAETDPDSAYAINRDGASNVASIAMRLGIPVIHFSTDYVFDGTKNDRYVETDKTGPAGVYGRSKLDGELAVAAANDRHIILRTSWVYAPFGSNFVRTMLRLASDGKRLRVIDDQIGCPTYAPDIANATLTIARKVLSSGWQTKWGGVTHLAGPDEVTWCTFARRIMRISKSKGVPGVPVDAITSAEYAAVAARPANSRLDCDRLSSVFDLRLPALDASLESCLERLILGSGNPRSLF